MIPRDRYTSRVKMNLSEMNNEVVRMRHFVRQARTCVINKLVREAKTLRSKHGDEKQRQKYLRKADRLIAEVLAAKKIKDDDAILFGIDNKTELKDVLSDSSASEHTRALARLTNHKSLRPHLQKFRERFPDHEAYVESRRKKRKNPRKKSIEKKGGKIKKEEVPKNKSASDESRPNDSDLNSDERSVVSSKDDSSVTNANETTKRKITKSKISEKIEKTPVRSSNAEDVPSVEPISIVKPVAKETTVKRFSEFLRTQHTEDTHRNEEEPKGGTETSIVENGIEKENDTFFLSANDTEYYANSIKVNSKEEEPRKERGDRIKNYPISKLREINSKREFFSMKNNKLKHFENDGDSWHERRSKKNDVPTNFSQRTRAERRKAIANENEKLHPSWEARKKQREIMSNGFQGKKIVFDDD